VCWLDLLQTAARAAGTRAAARDATVSVDAPAALQVEADPDRLRQAVDNLLANATRHAPPGSTVELVAAAPRPEVVTVEAADRGPGFPMPFLPRAFERFHRAESSRSRDAGGTGLGLSIVRAVARAHGGDAIAANRPDGGAAVTIELPVRTPEPTTRYHACAALRQRDDDPATPTPVGRREDRGADDLTVRGPRGGDAP